MGLRQTLPVQTKSMFFNGGVSRGRVGPDGLGARRPRKWIKDADCGQCQAGRDGLFAVKKVVHCRDHAQGGILLGQVTAEGINMLRDFRHGIGGTGEPMRHLVPQH